MTVFALQSCDGAYAAYGAHDAGSASWVYWLTPASGQPVPSVELKDAWGTTGPWALIVRDSAWEFAAETPSAAATTLGFKILATSQSAVIAWRADPAVSAAWWPGPGAAPEYQMLILDPNTPNRQVRVATTVAFGNIQLTVPIAATVSLGGDGASLHFARTGSQFTLGRSDKRISLLSWDQADLLTSDAAGVAAGGLRTTGVTWSARQTFMLGQDPTQVTAMAADLPDIRYWWGPAAGQRLRLPMFPAADFNTPDLGLDFALNAALPFDPAATRFDVAAATNGCFTSTASLMTRDSRTVGLTPVSGIGFHLAPGFVAGQNSAYLAPYGRFALVAPTSGGGAPFALMPGLSGLEYITANAGDLLDLVPAQPAFGAPPTPGANGDPGDPPALTTACTTSWMRLTPSGAPSRPYYAQPLASVFYASPDSTAQALPRATDALVSNLTGAEPVYPLAPYANLFAATILNPPAAGDVTDFEHTYLASRRGVILGSRSQPVFSIDGNVLTQIGATPRGLMAEIGPTPPAPSAAAPTKGGPRAAALDAKPTPDGQWRRLYLAKGVSNVVTLEPNADGVVDPVVGNALLQPDLFMVYNNWAGHPLGVAGELDVGGFSFDWAPLDGKDPSMLLVAKFTTKVCLTDLFASPERWRDSDVLVGDGTAVAGAQAVYAAALKTARDAQKAGSTLFDDFLQRIAADPSWTGLVVFQAPVDGNAMPATLQILVAGMRAPLRAHHLAVDVTALTSPAGVPTDVGPSSVVGVISYDDPGGASPAGSGDYGFYTQSLKVGIYSSAVTSFNAEVGIAANTLFGRDVELRPQANDPPFPDTFLLKGVYHVIANVPTVSFQIPEARVFDFTVDPGLPGGGLDRVLGRFEIDSAGILPQEADPPDNGGDTTHEAQITLSGQLWFNPDPFGVGVDLFSYGVDTGTPVGLTLNNFGLEMSFVLDGQGQRKGPPTLVPDYSRMGVAEPAGALRPGGLVGGLPFKLKGILGDDAGLDVAKLGGKPVQVLQIAGKETQTPHFALQFELIIGSLGELSSVHAGLTAEMRLAWGPRAATPDADGALLTIQLPGASAGFNDLNVQGMLKVVFGEANLLKVAYDGSAGGQPADVYAILFNNVALSVMGISLPPKVISDLVLFSDPRNATGSNLAACLAVRQQ